MKIQYDQIAEEYSKLMDPIKKHVLIPSFIGLINKSDLKGKKALDLACGHGVYTRILAKFHPRELIGVDISEEMIKKAMEIEEKERSGIKYLVGDATRLSLDERFDLITAVYLLNYSKTKKDLLMMCEGVSSHLSETGSFYAVTTDPSLRPTNGFEYERKTTNSNGNAFFADGDRVIKEHINSKGGTFSFSYYYWSKKAYEDCLKEAGFKSIQWIPLKVSKEGIKEYGKKFWNALADNPSSSILVCKK